MMQMIKILGLISIVILLFTGCGGSKVYNVNHSNTLNMQKATTVEYAIRKASTRKGWSVQKNKEGVLTVSQNIKGNYLVVLNIIYDKNGYQITHKDSTNLDYDPDDDTIHKSYNKWVHNLERNINKYLHKLSNMSPASLEKYQSRERNVFNRVASIATGMPLGVNNSAQTQQNTIDIKNQTIYIAKNATYDNPAIKESIINDCTINSQVMQFIKDYATGRNIDIQFKDNIQPNELELKISITNAISRGSAFIGHYKYVEINGELIKDNKVLSSFRAARKDGGGRFGGYKGSCSVLGRATKVIGRDVSYWLSNPINNASLGHLTAKRFY